MRACACICDVHVWTVHRELEKQGLKVFHKEKKKMAFMQKYHHKGAFYLVCIVLCVLSLSAPRSCDVVACRSSVRMRPV